MPKLGTSGPLWPISILWLYWSSITRQLCGCISSLAWLACECEKYSSQVDGAWKWRRGSVPLPCFGRLSAESITNPLYIYTFFFLKRFSFSFTIFPSISTVNLRDSINSRILAEKTKRSVFCNPTRKLYIISI